MEDMEIVAPTAMSRFAHLRRKIDFFVTCTMAFPFYIWVMIFAHFAEGITSYTVSMKLTKYLNQRLLMDDIEASTVYSERVFVVLILALVGGWLIDKIGKKASIVLGFFDLGLVKIALSVVSNKLLAELLIIVGLPVGSGLLVTPIHMVVDMLPYNTEAQQAMKNFAFSMLYTSNNFGDEIAGLADPYVSGTGGAHQYDMLFSAAGFISLIAGVLVFFTFYPPNIREVDVIDGNIDYGKQLKKCLWFAICMCPVRTLFQYLDVLMSKYIERLHDAVWMLNYGRQIDSTAIITINPITALILTPIMGLLLKDVKTTKVLIIGTLMSALSPIILVLWRDINSSLPEEVFMLVFSISEAIYSSRSIQFLMTLTPPGKKGLYSTIAILPALIASGLASEQAGYLLYYFCPTTVTPTYNVWQLQSAQNLWIPIILVALATPIMLFFSRSYLESPMAALKLKSIPSFPINSDFSYTCILDC